MERHNISLLKRIKIAQAEKRDWKVELQSYLFMYRSSAHTVTGVSPGEMLFNRKIRSKLPNISQHRSDFHIRDRD